MKQETRVSLLYSLAPALVPDKWDHQVFVEVLLMVIALEGFFGGGSHV